MSEHDETVDASSGSEEQKSIRELIAEALGDLLSSGKAEVAESDGKAKAGDADIEEQVTRAVRKVKSDTDRDSVIAGLQGQVEKLTKAVAEGPPVRLRSIEKLMGWHDE